MFIHLGGDTIIRSKDVIAILSSDMKESSGITKEFLKAHFTKSNVQHISEELIKSIVITVDKIYYSPISSVTLKRRAQAVSELDSFAE
ncbi:extracellular matrix regulator RemB [Bacillus alkalicellulosilyticus]|uniref:extracellular matrix regulator RemB n=1 Tax=Alkalihalobacterium alkalicellulosilyticum TaxID=1912214 RepID=UPI000998E2FB|nr:extracellular matrix/biofilm biosynthesis regulator RemA family protein [Bacillus alkalicellulosilyticus]